MTPAIKIGIVGDFDPQKESHRATNAALSHAAESLKFPISIEWLPTRSLEHNTAETLYPFHALWCSPGSPYESMEGALAGIQVARKQGIPFIGT